MTAPNLNRLAQARALALLAELVESGVELEGEIMEGASASGIRVVVSVLRDVTKMAEPARVIPRKPLNAGQQAVVDLLNHDTPRKMLWLWQKLGKATNGKQPGGYFKSMLTDLCRMGIATRLKTGGYLLADGGGPAS